MRKILILLVVFILTACTGKSPEPIKLSQKVLLPDGQSFPFWDDQTVYEKVFFVDQNNSMASDENTGTSGHDDSSAFLAGRYSSSYGKTWTQEM